MRHGLTIAAALAAAALAGCTTPGAGIGPARGAYDLSAQPEGQVEFAMLDEVNALRAAAGAPALTLDAALSAAAVTHSRDMARQNRPWHFSSDGSSPLDRVRRTGFRGGFLGQVIAESFETERETVGAWTQEPGSREVLLNPAARQAGIGWFQEPGGKIWWTLVTGAPRAATGALPPAPGIAAPLPAAGGFGGGAIALPEG